MSVAKIINEVRYLRLYNENSLKKLSLEDNVYFTLKDMFVNIHYIEDCLKANEFSSKLQDMFPAIDEKIENLYLKLSEYFIENQQKYERAIMELNIPQINESMNVIKKWNTLLKKIKRYSEIHNSDYVSVAPLCKIVESCKFYLDTVTEASYKLRNLKNEILSFELVEWPL